MENNLNDEKIEIMRRNLEISEEILKKTDYIKGYVKWQKVWGIINILIIVIPIMLGVIYLPPLIKDYLNQITSLYK